MTGDHDDYDDDDFLDDFVLDEGAESAAGDTGSAADSASLEADSDQDTADASDDGFDVSSEFEAAAPDPALDDVDELGTADLPTPADPLPAEQDLSSLEDLEEFALADPFEDGESSTDVDGAEGAQAPDSAIVDDPLFGDRDAGDAVAATGETGADPDEDDMLFEDHTQGVDASETFARKQQFDEGNPSEWQGEQLELDSEDEALVSPTLGQPEGAEFDAGIPIDDEAGTPVELGAPAEFVSEELPLDSELDSLLEEDEFALDSEGELEIVGGDTVAGSPVNETVADGNVVDESASTDEVNLEGGEAFVIEDVGADWQEVELGASATSSEEETAGVEVESTVDYSGSEPLEPAALEGLAPGEDGVELAPGEGADAGAEDCEFIGSLSEAASSESEGQAEGWEPLPGTRMDELAEVDGVEAVDEESAGEPVDSYAPAPHLVEATADASEHDDLYADGDEDDDPEVVGGYQERHKLFGMLTAVAALLVVGLGALIAVLRPELIGLRFAPEKVEVVQLARPRVDLDITPPPLPVADLDGPSVSVAEPPKVVGVSDPGTGAGNEPATGDGEPATTDPAATDPSTSDPAGADPNAADPGAPDPEATDPGTTTPAGTATDPQAADPVTADPQLTDPTAGGPATEPIAADPGTANDPVAITPSPTGGNPESWPIAGSQAQPEPSDVAAEDLLPMGDNLLAGGQTQPAPRLAADGVLPGSRAFAQLDNGNYFIGSVKAVNGEFLTLRLRDGEISLARESIVKLTGLGSTDFEELQRATSGFVRLTNNNRLVGSILEGIRDDHVILQTRSNRVMLPKSVVGKIVEQANESGVRLGTTNEEDAWLRRLSEQQLRGSDPRAATPKPDGGSGR